MDIYNNAYLTSKYAGSSLLESVKEWKAKAGRADRYMSVNNSSWHMSVFPKFHSTLEDVRQQMAAEQSDPTTYSITSVVWDLSKDVPIYIWHDDDFKLPTPSADDVEKYTNDKRSDEESIALKKEMDRMRSESLRIFNEDRKNYMEKRERLYTEYIQECMTTNKTPLPFSLFNEIN